MTAHATLAVVDGSVSPAIVAREVVRAYATTRALDGFSLEVPRGTIFGLVGPNGSGKSTFLGLVAEAAEPDSGTLLLFGEPPHRRLRRHMGVVFQENTADPLMSALETLELAGRLYGLTGRESRERGAELLVRFGLGEVANRRTGTFSGGMRRRVELARALLHSPELVLLDEPTTGVDPDETRAFWNAVRESDGAQLTVVVGTNNLTEADAVCDRVAFVRSGRVIACGTPAELKRGMARETVRLATNGTTDEDLSALMALAGVESVTRSGNDLRVTTEAASPLVPAIFSLRPGWIHALSIDQTSLEDAYFAHIGERVRRPEKVS